MHAEPQLSPFMETQAPMLIAPIPQKWSVTDGEIGGKKVAVLTVMSPHNTALLALSEEDALKLADSLRAKFSGLAIAQQIPRAANGSPPLGAQQ